MWEEKELESVEFIPEPTDSRIVSAADPNTVGHQESWRSEVLGWAPEPVPVIPRRDLTSQRIVNVGVFLIVLLILWGAWRSQYLISDLPPPTSEWAFEDSGIRDLQELGFDGTGVRLCMVDTGIDAEHPDLQNLDLVYKDFITGDSMIRDHGTLGHGTMMAGIVAGDGVIDGIAPGITLGMAAALGPDSDGENSANEQRVANAIRWCWEQFDADIISLSLGGETNPNATREGPTTNAVKLAIANGVYVVAAAGNDGGPDDDGMVATPSNVKEVISVGALNKEGNIWDGSSIGSTVGSDGTNRTDPHLKPEISAPGVNIISTGPSNTYYSSTGTSDSTVFVAGALALILQAEPSLADNPNSSCMELVKLALRDSANPLVDDIEHNQKWGYGALDGNGWLLEIRQSGTC
ncbi:MAG: S8 family serine peptidase [Candidatus Poseidoniaceae archaeon]|jgi:serine protease AprX|nr:S8 family serine peptidase [Candidatus Poseidoniaceae archaeon]